MRWHRMPRFLKGRIVLVPRLRLMVVSDQKRHINGSLRRTRREKIRGDIACMLTYASGVQGSGSEQSARARTDEKERHA